MTCSATVTGAPCSGFTVTTLPLRATVAGFEGT